jgi:HAD superfamily hydrolase (TIGR01509 family)
MLKVCAFDLGNTLSDDAALLAGSLADTAAWLAGRELIADPERFIAAYREINDGTFTPFISHTYGEPEFFESAFARLGVTGIGALEALGKYRSFLTTRSRVSPELPAALDWLKSAGFRLAILSNERVTRVNAFLERTGINACFDQLIVSEGIGVEKPDERFFRLALERCGVAGEEMVMFGDNEIADGACKRLGMPFVLCTEYKKAGWGWEEGSPHAPDYVMKRITRPELEEFFASKIALRFAR